MNSHKNVNCIPGFPVTDVTQTLCLSFFNYNVKKILPPQFCIVPKVLSGVILVAEHSEPRPALVTWHC